MDSHEAREPKAAAARNSEKGAAQAPGVVPATELPGVREAQARLTQEVDRALRYKHAFSLALVDLDPIAPPPGQSSGLDPRIFLADFVRAARSIQRECDVMSKWTGNLIVWLLPETELDAGVLACERMRKALAAAGGGNYPQLTLSVGVAELEPGEDGSSLAKRAHDALLISQARGRNCVTRADILPRPDSAA